jgi:small subunit ribosomal protein S8
MNITDLIIVLKNASKTSKSKITVPSSKKIIPFLEVLCQEGFVYGFSKVSVKETNIFLHYTYKKNKILSFTHLSKPSKPIYFSCQDLWKFSNSLNTIILSTSHGIISHRMALRNSIGGKVLCILI